MADKRVSDLPRATELGDNDLLVVEQGGAAKSATVAAIAAAAMPKDALELIRRVLDKGVYTEDVSALLTALDAALSGGGGSEEPDEPNDGVTQSGPVLTIRGGVQVVQSGATLTIT